MQALTYEVYTAEIERRMRLDIAILKYGLAKLEQKRRMENLFLEWDDITKTCQSPNDRTKLEALIPLLMVEGYRF